MKEKRMMTNRINFNWINRRENVLTLKKMRGGEESAGPAVLDEK